MGNYADSTKAPTTLTEAEQKALLRVTGERRAGFRDHCIYSLAFGTGLRQHEIVALNVGDVFDEQGKAKRRVQLRVFKNAKRKRASAAPTHQDIVLPDLVRTKLEKLLAGRKRRGEVIAPESPLFVSRLGKRISARTVRHNIGVWQERAGFERHHGFHGLRHSACTNVYRQTKDIRLTQRFARHESIESTVIYTHPSDEELLRAVQGLTC